jgi:hypothetical protein
MSGMGVNTYGNQTGFPLRVAADQPQMKADGITIDWTNANVPTNTSGANITLPDGTVVLPNEKYLRYGQVMLVTVTSNLQNKAVPVISGSTLVKGRVFIMNETVKQNDPYMSDHAGGAIEGGRVYRRRLFVGTTWGIAGGGPISSETEANVLAAMPLIQPVDD